MKLFLFQMPLLSVMMTQVCFYQVLIPCKLMSVHWLSKNWKYRWVLDWVCFAFICSLRH